MRGAEKLGEQHRASPEVVRDIAALRSLVFQQPDCIVIPGHSIVKAEVRGKEVWIPTLLVQKLDEQGWRTGILDPRLTFDDNAAYVGGGIAATLAGIQFFEDASKTGTPPRLVIFAAGRPPYLRLDQDLGLTEGGPMESLFRRNTRFEEGKGSDIVILDKNQTTRDDVEESLKLAFERGLGSVIFIMLDMRIARAKIFLDKTIEEVPKYQSLDIKFVPAEILLEERFMGNAVQTRLFKETMERFKTSSAFMRTKKDEEDGIARFLSGGYKVRQY